MLCVPVDVVGNASLCVLGCRGLMVGTQNVSFTDDTGLRFDERKLVESTVSTLYGMALFDKSASWLETKMIEWTCENFESENSSFHVHSFFCEKYSVWKISQTWPQTPDFHMPFPVDFSQTNSIYTSSSRLYREKRPPQWQWETIWSNKVPPVPELNHLDRWLNPLWTFECCL